jgi:hypothetical protein
VYLPPAGARGGNVIGFSHLPGLPPAIRDAEVAVLAASAQASTTLHAAHRAACAGRPCANLAEVARSADRRLREAEAAYRAAIAAWVDPAQTAAHEAA